MLYGATVWDPVQIVTQIAALQGIFCISAAVLLALFVGKTNRPHFQALVSKFQAPYYIPVPNH